MIRRIELVNFMSHARTVIEPAEGLTVLVGPNNCGKSSMVAALQILCHNESSTYVTRHHERECSVTIETDDGHVVEWRRKNSPSYIVDGVPFDRLGRSGSPEGLHDVLRLPKVLAEGNQEFDVHFGEQKSPVFLLDKPGSHAAQFFASSSDAASLVEMQKRHVQKQADARRERTRLEGRSARLAIDLSNLEPVDAIEPTLLQLEKEYEHLQQSAIFSTQMSHDLEELRRATEALNHHVSRSMAVGSLVSPPNLTDSNPLQKLIQEIAGTQNDFDALLGRSRVLETLASCPDVTEENTIRNLFDQLEVETSSLSRATEDCTALRELAALPAWEDPRALEQLIADIRSQQPKLASSEARLVALSHLETTPACVDERMLANDIRRLSDAWLDLNRAERSSRRLAELQVLPPIEDPAEMGQMIRLIVEALDDARKLDQEVTEASTLHLTAANELREFATRNCICPTCGSALDPDRLVERACSHGERDAIA